MISCERYRTSRGPSPAFYESGQSRCRALQPGTDGESAHDLEVGSSQLGRESIDRGQRSRRTASKDRLVIDASEFGIDAVVYAVLAVLVGVPFVGLLIAAVASRLGGRRFGFGSIGMGIVVAVAAVVDVVVLQRTISGEVTGWDLLWAGGLTLAAVWSLRRLALPLRVPT